MQRCTLVDIRVFKLAVEVNLVWLRVEDGGWVMVRRCVSAGYRATVGRAGTVDERPPQPHHSASARE